MTENEEQPPEETVYMRCIHYKTLRACKGKGTCSIFIRSDGDMIARFSAPHTCQADRRLVQDRNARHQVLDAVERQPSEAPRDVLRNVQAQ